MILTPLNIQIAIIKAWYSIALKSIKYYGGLAVGKNNSCLLKEARLLRKYVEILRNFKIVGSTITCSCCLEGDYTVLLNDLSELTEAKIQFNCDNGGSMYFNDVNYPFDYIYDADNSNLVLNFTTLFNPITEEPFVLSMQDITFLSNCDFTTSTSSPIEEATIEPITEPPVTNDYWINLDGNITIYEPNGTTLLTAPQNPLTIPASIINDPQAIADYWNNNGIPGWILLYDNNQFTMLTSFDQVDYSGYIIQFNQYEGGIDSRIINATFIPQEFVPVGTRASREFDIANTFIGSVQAQALISTPTIPQFITIPTLAKAQMLIPKTMFSTVQQSATMTIEIEDEAMFGTLNPSDQFFYYGPNLLPSVVMFNHTGPYADPAALVTDFNNNNGNGFIMTYIGPSTNAGYSQFKIDSPINGQSYNNGIITIIYSSTVSYQNTVGTFAGGKSIKPLSLSITDTFGLSYNVVSPVFSNVQDFISDFNTNNGLGYNVTLGTGNILFDRLIFTAPGPSTFVFNGTPITFTANDPTFITGTYTNIVNYSGGVDTTQCRYALDIYDSGNNFVGSISIPTSVNFSSLADVATDINSNVINVNPPYGFGASATNNQMSLVYPSPFILPESLVCSTYNNYYFKLYLIYDSPQYSAYISDNSYMTGGVDANSKEFEISDSANGILFSRALNTYNYPNGSEIQNGLIPDFNANNLFNYTAQYIGPGTTIPPQPSISSNTFITELTTATISNGQEIRAYIDNTYIGKYQAPVSGVLPSYNQMILNLKNDIASLNPLGLSSITSSPTINPTTITLISPTGQEVAYNGKLFKIQKHTYTSATTTLTFGNVATFTHFQLSISGLGTIANIQINSATTSSQLAIIVTIFINNSGTGLTATFFGNVVTVTAPPYTGGSFNGVPIRITTINTPPYNAGSVVINSTTYLTTSNWFEFPINGANFIGGQTFTPTLIKQEPFAGGVNQITTTRIKVLTPNQPSGVGNWAFNSEFLSYNYNLGEYTVNGVYSGGIDTTVGQLTVEILDPLLAVYATLYDDLTPQNYLSRQSLINIFNAANPLPVNFQIIYSPNPNKNTFLSPTDSDIVDADRSFVNSGVDPVLTPYEGIFQQGDIGTFVTSNPCEPTIAEQECLTNNDVVNIIRHIDRIVK
jgi:hypothetical protein